jgi:hypothetical protein
LEATGAGRYWHRRQRESRYVRRDLLAILPRVSSDGFRRDTLQVSFIYIPGYILTRHDVDVNVPYVMNNNASSIDLGLTGLL